MRSEGGKGIALGANGAFCATEKKVRFASRHWSSLRDATPEDLFARLGFAYRRILPPAGMAAKQPIKTRWIEAIENELITIFEPTCNTKGRRGADGLPAGLQAVSDALDLATARVAARL